MRPGHGGFATAVRADHDYIELSVRGMPHSSKVAQQTDVEDGRERPASMFN
jgi:hypothetical protein